jgi:hypothetical protein
MGIDYIVKSNSHPNLFGEDDPNQFIKWAWRDIKWEEICELCGFEKIIYSFAYVDDDNYIKSAQVKEMRDDIQSFVDKTFYIEKAQDKIKLDVLHDDAVKLLAFFQFYVDHDASITII